MFYTGNYRKEETENAMEKILFTYYADNAKRLHMLVDKILLKFGGLSNKDLDDFYSLANEVFVDVMRQYDGSKSFDSFLYSCLSNRIKTEMTKRNREKRRIDRLCVSIDALLDGGGEAAAGDLIVDDFTVEREVFDKRESGYSQRMLIYLSRLSSLQKEILRLDMAGYLPDEIKEKLHISEKQYSDCYAAIRSYRNVSILF